MIKMINKIKQFEHVIEFNTWNIQEQPKTNQYLSTYCIFGQKVNHQLSKKGHNTTCASYLVSR